MRLRVGASARFGLAELFLLGFLGFSAAAKSDDVITDLPGLTFNPNFNQYSGFLDATPGNHLHYWLVEAQTNPQSAPLVLWLNGGPGCSSLLGMMTENGPFRANQDGTQLIENVHAWNKAANILYLESPRDIGFSYRDTTAAADRLYNDDKTATDNALALINFFQRFPEYNNRPFYITGESYGGVYVPTLTKLVIQMIQNQTLSNVNLVGMAVGNGMLSRNLLTNSVVDLLYYRGMLGVNDWEAFRQCCPDSPQGPLVDCDFSQFIKFDNFGNPYPRNDTNDPQTIACGKMVTDLSLNAVWMTYNDAYNTFQDCYNFTGTTQEQMASNAARKVGLHSAFSMSAKAVASSNSYSMFSTGANPFVDQGSLYNRGSTDALRQYPCYAEDSATTYLNRKEVRDALHIPAGVQAWQGCNDDVNENLYIQQTPELSDTFKFFVDSKYQLKVMIYNGDADMACNFLGDQWFVENLATSTYQFTLTKPRTPWNYTRPGGYYPQLAGYVKSWTYNNFALDILTVKGAGHLVPMDRPGPALQLFNNFVNNADYQTIVPYTLLPVPVRSQYAAKPQKPWTRKQADRVWSLPGLTYGINFRQYSGYLNGVTGNYLHYWFVESQNNPSTDPLVLWLTGGPGCSGLLAFLTELGPFHPNADGKTLFENVYAWNKAANILFIESPRGVGFSVQDQSQNTDTVYDDDRTAKDTLLALKDFFTVYPEYNGRQFFVTGESYGGVYVPTLTSVLIDEIQAGRFPQLNLVGISIGNGELSDIYQFNSAIMMSYFHGLFGKEDFDSLQPCCNSSKTNSQWFEYCDFSQYVHIATDGTPLPNDNSFCATKIATLGSAMWYSLNNVYNIYQDCYQQNDRAFGSLASSYDKKHMYRGFIDQGSQISMSSTDNQGGFLCYATDAAATYLNQPDIRNVLHISPMANRNWSACNDDINNNYVRQHNDTGVVFEHMIRSGYPLRVLIYNGDVDQACNFLGDQWFVEDLTSRNNFAVVQQRNSWTYMTALAGYAKKFDNNAGFTIDLLTVKGAGHLVPTDRPGAALQMITNFFRSQDYSNPSIFDTSLHPLKTAYKISQSMTNYINGTNSQAAVVKSLSANRKSLRSRKIRRPSIEASNTQEFSKQQQNALDPPKTHTKEEDEVTNLPGLTYETNFKMFSGYLNASTGNYLHYWLTESQVSAANDPLILWLNGGPGCSSLGGFLEELGPFHVNSDGKTLFENVFSWNKVGNVLFLEAPRGVGFSYRSNEVPADPYYNDTYTASDTIIALQSFFAKFPEYKNRKFFITGESYGGVYVPTLTNELIKQIQSGAMSYVNLAGIGIGNGEMSEILQVNSAVSLLYFRGERDKSDWDALAKCCDTTKPQTYCDFTSYINLDTAGNAWPKVNDNSIAGQCGKLVFQQGFMDVWATNNDVYNTFMDCYAPPDSIDSKLNEDTRGARRTKRAAQTDLPPLRNKQLYIDQATKINYGSTDANGGFSCMSGDSAQNYLNLETVRGALHIPPNFPFWTDCNDDINGNYVQQHNDTSDVFQQILNSGYKLKFLIYNGDVDMACQFLGDQWFTEKLAAANQMAVTRQRDAWNYTQGQYLPRIGGYWKQFSHSNGQDIIDVVTVKGAGHFVPQDRPGPALQMIYNFVNGEDYNRNLTLDLTRRPLLYNYDSPADPVLRRQADRVFELPGLTFQPNFGFHAGYLKASPGNYLYYWFAESQSDDPRSDPIVLWLQGGPGCASTGGLFAEIGPFFPNPDGTTLFENVYAWNKAANLLIIDSPRAVGFSYQDKSVNNDNNWDDDKTAADTALALEDFFSAYPQFLGNKFFVAGESYGGIYVPTLTNLLIKRIQGGQSKINLQGMMIGNGFLSAVQDTRTLPDLLYFHGIYDKPEWEKLRQCCPSVDSSYYCNYDIYIDIDNQGSAVAKKFANATMQACANLVEQMAFDRNWAATYDQYNLYQDCYSYPVDSSSSLNKELSSRMNLFPQIHRKMSEVHQSKLSDSQPQDIDALALDPLSTDADGGFPCWQFGGAQSYFSQSHVRDAIHVPDFVQQWNFCNDINYAVLYNDTTPVFESIMASGFNLRVLIYNGDVDTVCSMFEAEAMINNFANSNGFAAPQPRAPWLYAQQIGGYVQKYQARHLTIDLATVKGAGHGVPTDRPGPTLQLITNFIISEPNYNTPVPFDFTRQPLLPQFMETGNGGGANGDYSTTISPPISNPTSASSRSTATTATVPTTTRSSSSLQFISSVAFLLLSYLLL